MEPSSSFHNVVSQASHLVEQVLQDHISDPEQMTQSLKRLETTGKRLLKWGLGHGSQKIGAAGDCGMNIILDIDTYVLFLYICNI